MSNKTAWRRVIDVYEYAVEAADGKRVVVYNDFLLSRSGTA